MVFWRKIICTTSHIRTAFSARYRSPIRRPYIKVYPRPLLVLAWVPPCVKARPLSTYYVVESKLHNNGAIHQKCANLMMRIGGQWGCGSRPGTIWIQRCRIFGTQLHTHICDYFSNSTSMVDSLVCLSLCSSRCTPGIIKCTEKWINWSQHKFCYQWFSIKWNRLERHPLELSNESILQRPQLVVVQHSTHFQPPPGTLKTMSFFEKLL